ncbi:hypothetical protein LTR85_011328 [Meristemomyces frigidus]|nr:hypothetical protein LTR85_011328 [Meristemomyces frigidus]
MASAAAALTAMSPATAMKIAKAIKSLQDARDVRRQRMGALNNVTALDVDVRAQVDEVLLVLALLGEVLLPLSVFNNTYYPQTVDKVEACMVSGGHDIMPAAFGELDAELQYAVTAGLAFCSTFAPMPVYRGFGAAVLGDWSWGCPDTEQLLKKLKVKGSAMNGFLGRSKDPQPNRPVLVAFDQVIQMLQVKQVAFLSVKPTISGFAEQQPRYDPRSVRKFWRELDLQTDWTRRIEKVGHPSPTGRRTTTWAIPFATWTSTFSCEHQKSKHAWETIMAHQMDPGRLLHAFVCRGNLNLSESQLLVLPPGTVAESLACWLEGLPSMTHNIVRWSDLDTTGFETKCSKGLRKHLAPVELLTGVDDCGMVTTAEPAATRTLLVDAQPPTAPSRVISEGELQHSTNDLTDAVEMPAEASSYTYLELLNRVARGEISPQALSQMLQARNAAQKLDATPLKME